MMKEQLQFTLIFMYFIVLAHAQTSITIHTGPSDCYVNDIVSQNGSTGSGNTLRYTYTQNCSNNGCFPVRVIYSTTNNRWEIQSNPFGSWIIDYYSTFLSRPKAPDKSVANWVNVDPGTCANLITFTGTGTQTVLPIELAQFDVNTEGSKNHLTWTTAIETNNKGFDIERSTDGKDFTAIGTVKAANKASTYQYTDNQPFAMNYYRLRQIDNDGKETLSKVLSVSMTSKGKLNVYPNPVTHLLTIDVPSNDVTDYQILNLLGKQVLNGKTVQQIDVSALPQGAYFLKVGTEQVKFVKQ